jgi:hypothetical protein
MLGNIVEEFGALTSEQTFTFNVFFSYNVFVRFRLQFELIFD